MTDRKMSINSMWLSISDYIRREGGVVDKKSLKQTRATLKIIMAAKRLKKLKKTLKKSTECADNSWL